MIITTTPTIEGRPVKDYLGIVSGETVLADGMFTGLPGMPDTLLQARHQAMSVMTQRAEALGANAVVGVSVDLEIQSVIRFVLVTGTAVHIP